MYCNFSGIENTLTPQNSLLQYTALHPPRSPFSFLLQAPQKRLLSKIFPVLPYCYEMQKMQTAS